MASMACSTGGMNQVRIKSYVVSLRETTVFKYEDTPDFGKRTERILVELIKFLIKNRVCIEVFAFEGKGVWESRQIQNYQQFTQTCASIPQLRISR